MKFQLTPAIFFSRVMNPPPKLAPTFPSKYASKYGICFMLTPSVKVCSASIWQCISTAHLLLVILYKVYVMASSKEAYRKWKSVWATLSCIGGEYGGAWAPPDCLMRGQRPPGASPGYFLRAWLRSPGRPVWQLFHRRLFMPASFSFQPFKVRHMGQ